MLKVKSLAGSLFLLLFLTFIHPCSGETSGKTVVVLQNGQSAVQYTESSGGKTTKTLSAFNSPSFVAGMINSKEFLAIISSGRVDASPHGDYTDVVVRTRYGNTNQLTDAEMFYKISEVSGSHAPWGDTTAVMNGDKIYVLITSMRGTNFGNTLHEPSMIVGTVKNRTAADSNEVYIEWGKPTSLKAKLPESVHEIPGSQFIGGEGNGIVTTNGKIIFPIVMINGNEKFASILYSDDNGDRWLIGGKTESGTSDGSLVERSNGKLLFTVASKDGIWKVFESDDFGIKWIPSPVFSAVWGNSENHKGRENPGSVTTVPVEKEVVLLFAYPQNKNKENFFDTLQLWLSDGLRIMCIGTISDETNEKNTGHSVLAYVGGNLYVTHQINPPGLSNQDTTHTGEDWKNVIGLTPLPELFAKVKKTVLAWRKLDEGYKSKNIPTDVLMGFLGNTKADDDNVWEDIYNCVNAIVKGGKSVSGGVSFDGETGSGAKWPVISQGQNQVYKFTETQFTLAATIIIQKEITAEDVSVIGASADDKQNSLLFDIGHTKEKKWYARKKDSQKIDTGVSFVLEKEHQFVITFANKMLSVYVDGVEAANAKQTFENEFLIDHFFFGQTASTAAKNNGGLFTAKNVMLFSRALNQREITDFGKVKEIPPPNKPIQAEEEIIPTTKPEVHSKTISTSLPEKRELQPTEELKEASQFVDNDVTKAKINKTEIINSLPEYRNAAIPKDAKVRKDAAMSLSAVHVMCLACFLVALAGF